MKKKNSIVWLHLSDSHLCKKKTGWDAHHLMELLVEDLRGMEADHGLHPDLIFFCGDLVFGDLPESHINEQFKDANVFLESIRNAFFPPILPGNVFVVPGNHEVNRTKIADSETQWLNMLSAKESDVAKKKVNDMIQAAGVQWRRFAERLSNYRNFIETIGYSHLLQDKRRLIFSDTRVIECFPEAIPIGIIGLNSAWSSSKQKEKGDLWLGSWQIGELSKRLKDTLFNVVLIHHPISWLNQYEDPDLLRDVEVNSKFLLHGHEHKTWVDQKEEHVTIASAACYQRSDKENGYNIVRLFPEERRGEVFLRQFDARSKSGWIPLSIAGKASDGCWHLTELDWLRKSQRRVLDSRRILKPSDRDPHSDFSRIAVLPFRYSKSEEIDELFADGFCDDIVSRLSKINKIRVLSLESTLPFRNTDKSAIAIAQELDVDIVLTGALRDLRKVLRLTIVLTEVASRTVLMAETYNFPSNSLAEAQNRIATSVAKKLSIHLSKAENARITERITINPDGYKFYLRGRGFLFKNTEKDLVSSISMFDRAVSLDNRFADAVAAKAYGLWKLYFHGWDANESILVQAHALARTAMKMNPSSAMARMAVVRICWDLGWHERALKEGKKALDQNPTSVDALVCKARAYNNSGMADKAIPLVQEVLSIEKNNPAALKLLIFNYAMTGQYSLACQTAGNYFAKNPGDSNTCWAVMMAYLSLGKPQKAIEVGRFGLDADPTNYTLWLVLGYAFAMNAEPYKATEAWNKGVDAVLSRTYNLRSASWLSILYAAARRKQKAILSMKKILSQKKDNAYLLYRLANAFAILGMKAKALSMLRQAIAKGFLSVQMMKREEILFFQDLQHDPEYKAILHDLERKVDLLRRKY